MRSSGYAGTAGNLRKGRLLIKRVGLFALVGCFALAGTSLAAKPKPKLSVAGLSSPPATAKAGDQLTLRGRVANRGDRGAHARVRITLRESKRSAPVAVLASKRVKVRARKEKRFSATVAVPVVPVGEYLLVACVQRGGNKGPKKCRASTSRVAIEAAPAPQPQPASQPTFTPGSRTLGDPLLPQIGNGGYDALHYAIDLDYDRAANVFDSASTTITARATQNLSKFSLDFQDLPIDSVTSTARPRASPRTVRTSRSAIPP